jgi:hypothetical protein
MVNGLVVSLHRLQAILFGSLPILLNHGRCGGLQSLWANALTNSPAQAPRISTRSRENFLGFRKALEKYRFVGCFFPYALKRAISRVAEGKRAPPKLPVTRPSDGPGKVSAIFSALRNFAKASFVFVFVLFLQFHGSWEDFVLLGFFAEDVLRNAGTDGDRIARGQCRSVCGFGRRRGLRSCQGKKPEEKAENHAATHREGTIQSGGTALVYGTRMILPCDPGAITSLCARSASANGISLPTTGRNAPFSKPAYKAA